MPVSVVTFDFDPLLRLAFDLVVRWQTVALAAVVATSLVVAGIGARRSGLRADDLLFIAVAVVPGAVIGARLGHALLHLDYYASRPGLLLDPGQGGLELGLGVLGGMLTGAYVAGLLGAPRGPWLHVMAGPLLFAIGAGKLALVLGGTGQGQPSAGEWATAYLGPGPWGSLAPAFPSHPSQAYEGIATLALAAAIAVVIVAGGLRRPDGRVFAIALVGWGLVRAAVSTTWRDPTVLGPFPVGGLIALGIATVGVGLLVFIVTQPSRAASGDSKSTRGVEWPDPASRPPF